MSIDRHLRTLLAVVLLGACTYSEGGGSSGRGCDPGDGNRPGFDSGGGPNDFGAPDAFEDGGALPPCDENKCETGHACWQVDGEDTCDEVCRSELCPRLFVCEDTLAIRCRPVDCAVHQDCRIGEFCYEFECYSEIGECERAADCPGLDRAAYGGRRLSCVEGLCTLDSTGAAPYSGWDTRRESVVEIKVTRPLPGETSATLDDVRFEWHGVGSPVIALVAALASDPRPSLEEDTVWGLSQRAGSAGGAASWSDGVAVSGGQWGGSPQPPRAGETLYFLVQALDQGELLGVSRFIPFQVADGFSAAWLHHGDDCTNDSRCEANPARSQVCTDGRCAALCASVEDCVALDCGDDDCVCGTPRDSVRVCE